VAHPGGAAVAALVVSATALALAPLLMPDSYSWVAHTTSESAAQGIEGAWLARAGLFTFGAGVILIVLVARDRWGGVGAVLHASFGVLMLAAGAFAARPWDRELAYSPFEDLVHSVAATAMGFAFAFGVAAVAVVGWRRRGRRRLLDVGGVVASVAIPLAMVGVQEWAGALQRLMFLVAYAWYGMESRPPARSRVVAGGDTRFAPPSLAD
jgi:hypothetical protein